MKIFHRFYEMFLWLKNNETFHRIYEEIHRYYEENSFSVDIGNCDTRLVLLNLAYVLELTLPVGCQA